MLLGRYVTVVKYRARTKPIHPVLPRIVIVLLGGYVTVVQQRARTKPVHPVLLGTVNVLLGQNVVLDNKDPPRIKYTTVIAAIAPMVITKMKMVSRVRHARFIPPVLLVRNKATCPQGRRTVLVTVAEAGNTKPMVLLPATRVIIVHRDMSSIQLEQVASHVLSPPTKLKATPLRSNVLRGLPVALDFVRTHSRHR